MKKLFFIVLLLMFFLLPGSSCYGEPAEAYYPLKEGMAWVYQVTSNKSGPQKVTITNLAPKEVQGKTVTPRKWDFGGGKVKYYFIGKDAVGVYRYAEQNGETGKPQVLDPKVYYLKNPADKGTYWDFSVKIGSQNLKVNVIIDAVRETVQVPAGTYKDCLKLKHQGEGPNIALTAYEWYAPGVGTVKSMFTIKRKAKKGAEDMESATFQLESFKP